MLLAEVDLSTFHVVSLVAFVACYFTGSRTLDHTLVALVALAACY